MVRVLKRDNNQHLRAIFRTVTSQLHSYSIQRQKIIVKWSQAQLERRELQHWRCTISYFSLFICGGPCHCSSFKQCSGELIFIWKKLMEKNNNYLIEIVNIKVLSLTKRPFRSPTTPCLEKRFSYMQLAKPPMTILLQLDRNQIVFRLCKTKQNIYQILHIHRTRQ